MDIQEIKIVLLGQDPYHGLNQANGLSFSVQNDIKIQHSLKNIFNFQNGTINFHMVI
jgi:uracil-DNA glycosylase